MERASFLLEPSGTRIDCLLNPASVIVRRRAGINTRHSSSGRLSGGVQPDDPLIYAGGGSTEILLDLLFDTSLTGADPAQPRDVRDLTLPLSKLAEGTQNENQEEQVVLVRFLWGKLWNVLGVVAATAERLEYFSPDGAPQRSWLRMRFLRVNEPAASGSHDSMEDLLDIDPPANDDVDEQDLRVFEVTGGGAEKDEEGGGMVERLDEIAYRLYGNPSWWRRIASFNNLDDPWNMRPGQLLSIPPGSAVMRDA